METPRLRASSHTNTMPIRPRPSTISPLLNQAEAIFTTTLMVANKKAPSTVQSACTVFFGSGVVLHRAAVPLVELLHAVFHRALVGAALVVAAQHERAAAGVHA